MNFVYKLIGSIMLAFTALTGNTMEIDYQKIAQAETNAWKAYYQKNADMLLTHTTTLLTAQYGIKRAEDADKVAADFFSAYYQFGLMDQHAPKEAYFRDILPLVIKAYQHLKVVTNAPWDAERAAKADLDWWVARRNDNELSVEKVGEKLAIFYTVIYGEEGKQFFQRAGYLRAAAARYRDLCQDRWGGVTDADWKMISSLLEQSYAELAISFSYGHDQ